MVFYIFLKFSFSLKQHIFRAHTGTKNHKCDDCEMAYVTKHELRNHKRRIHKFVYKRPVFDRPFKCDMCTCSYSKLKSLTRHKKVFHSRLSRGKYFS